MYRNKTLHQWCDIFHYPWWTALKKTDAAILPVQAMRPDAFFGIISARAGTIWSEADTIPIWYGPCRYATYSIRYRCTWLKISKLRILYFNNKVNALGWSIQWIQLIRVLKQNDCLCSVYHSCIFKVLVQHSSNSICLSMKVKCGTNSFGSGIVVVFLRLSPSFVSYSVPIVTVSSQP